MIKTFWCVRLYEDHDAVKKLLKYCQIFTSLRTVSPFYISFIAARSRQRHFL